MNLRREVVSQDGYRVSYVAKGDGPVLVMLPGMLQTAQDWEAVGYVDRFAARHRVLAVDLVGHGESDKPTRPEAYAAEAVAGRIGDLLDHERVSSAVLWGFGRGAEAAALVARRRPESTVAVICGGVDLGDAEHRLRVRGIDPTGPIERAAEALERGDWAEYFASRPGSPAPELREAIAAENDPLVIAAMTRADLLRRRVFLKPPAPTYAYWASGDEFAAENARTAETMAVEWAVIPGSAEEGFLLVDRVSTGVERFLDSTVRV